MHMSKISDLAVFTERGPQNTKIQSIWHLRLCFVNCRVQMRETVRMWFSTAVVCIQQMTKLLNFALWLSLILKIKIKIKGGLNRPWRRMFKTQLLSFQTVCIIPVHLGHLTFNYVRWNLKEKSNCVVKRVHNKEPWKIVYLLISEKFYSS